MTISAPLLGLLLVIAQTVPPSVPPRDARDPELKSGTGAISGRVTDAETGAPLARVDLSLTLLSTRIQMDAQSDANGAFAFARLPAGKYSLTADPTRRLTSHRPGSYRTGPPKPGRQWSTIVLQDGETFNRANIVLPRGFVVTARVVDEDGLPVADAVVKAEAVNVPGGGIGRSRLTDDLGAVRLWGYSPGTYRVCATPRSAGPDQRASEGYIETCYPSAPESEAQPIVITATDPPEVEIRLRRSRLFRISGVMVDPNGQIAAEARASLITLDRTGSSGRTIQSAGGAFSVRGVSPGEYFIKAEMPYRADVKDTARPIGYVAVSVQNADVQNVVVPLSVPPTVRGRFVFEGGPPPNPRSLTVQAYPARNSIAMAVGRWSQPAPVKPDLSFEIEGVVGPSTLAVKGPREWVVKSVRYGGQERINVPTEFRSHVDPAALEIVLTNRPAKLIARVLDEKGQPVEDARVLLFPADARQWDGAVGGSVWRFGAARNGVYEFADVRPADYLVAVLPDGMPFRDDNRRPLEELAQYAERITLLENDQKAVDLAVRR